MYVILSIVVCFMTLADLQRFWFRFHPSRRAKAFRPYSFDDWVSFIQRKTRLVLPVVCLALLSSCTDNARLLNIPFDPAGHSLNSLAADVAPEIAGQYIAFVSERQKRQNVYLYDFNARRLVDLPGLNALDSIASDPDVSADGRYIVFSAIRQGKSGIYFYDRDTRQLRNLTANLPAEVRNPTLSADGNTIAFESSANGQWDILVYDRSGQPLDVPIDPR
jgi:Tol biopolymer transport system component